MDSILALIKYAYSELFNWLVAKINEAHWIKVNDLKWVDGSDAEFRPSKDGERESRK